MAKKITMFELHFDGAHIGPSFGEKADTEPEVEESKIEAEPEDATASKGRTIATTVGAVAFVSLLGLGARRFRTRRSEAVGIDDVETAEATETPVEQ